MARLDVRRIRSKGPFQHAVELQSDEFHSLPTVLVAPLISPQALMRYPDINPVFQIEDREMALRIEQMIGIPRDRLGETVCNLVDREYEITRSVERLMFRS